MNNKTIITNNEYQEDQESIFDFFLEMIKMFSLAVVIIVPIKLFLFQPFIVRGISMEPTFSESEYLITNEFGYKYTEISLFGKKLFDVEPSKEFERQDIVVFRSPNKEKEYYIKRIIGLPGETIEVRNGDVFICDNLEVENVNQVDIDNLSKTENGSEFMVMESECKGKVLDESAYLPEGRKTNGSMRITLAEDEYFVLGDNRSHSFDSRSFGPRNKNEMIGKVLLRAWPFSRADLF